MQAKILSSALYGIDAFRVTVEVSIERGMGYTISGLPDDAIKESWSRLSSALNNNGFQMPRTKLVINLAPADIRKTGTAFDLPMAIGILLASGQIADLGKLKDYLAVGELGLDGSVYPVRGALPIAMQAKKENLAGMLLPYNNAEEAALIKGINIYPVRHLDDVLAFIGSDCCLIPYTNDHKPYKQTSHKYDFADVKGQQHIKHALEIAAAGGHNCMLIGPPGTGKTMLAKRLPSILPPLSEEESLETTKIYSIASNTEKGLITERPFRSPHHTTSDIALAGGGSIITPGEVSLAPNGVLFLDELPEFKRSAIEVLRQPLEDKEVFISRANIRLRLPASFMLVTAMNPWRFERIQVINNFLASTFILFILTKEEYVVFSCGDGDVFVNGNIKPLTDDGGLYFSNNLIEFNSLTSPSAKTQLNTHVKCVHQGKTEDLQSLLISTDGFIDKDVRDIAQFSNFFFENGERGNRAGLNDFKAIFRTTVLEKIVNVKNGKLWPTDDATFISIKRI